MFKVEFLVDDNKLGPVLQLITGKVMDLRQMPVANAKKENGKVVQKHNGGSLHEAFLPHILEIPSVKKSKRFTMDQTREVVAELGGSEGYVYGLLHRLKKEKSIKSARGGGYQILR